MTKTDRHVCSWFESQPKFYIMNKDENKPFSGRHRDYDGSPIDEKLAEAGRTFFNTNPGVNTITIHELYKYLENNCDNTKYLEYRIFLVKSLKAQYRRECR